ncbi:MAG TPA: glycosyltransferase family 87 protein [Candidatus Acidoferrales bacterium]|nr:glycosyltransferase family 87 protein [Candidatus Acidoferrales bacterium]
MAVWIVALMISGSLLAELPDRSNQLDFSHYYTSALAMRRGIDPYAIDLRPLANSLGLNVADNTRATYPPPFLLCFEPLTRLAPAHAYWTWISINAALTIVALFVLLSFGSHVDATAAVSLAGFALLYPPLVDNFTYAQSQVLVVLILALTMRWMERGMDRVAGIALAVAGLLRIFPLIMVGYLLARRRWTVLGYAIGGLSAGVAITLLLAGPRVTLSFARALPFVLDPRWMMRQVNVSLNAFVERGFVYVLRFPLPPSAEIARRIVTAIFELAIVAFTYVSTAAPAADRDTDSRAFSLWVVATVLLAPTAWYHYLVLLFIPFAQLASAASAGRASNRSVWMAAASVMTLSGALIVRGPLIGLLSAGMLATVREAPFASLVMAYFSAYWFVSDRIEAAPANVRSALAPVGGEV